jgi:hypothetical protein
MENLMAYILHIHLIIHLIILLCYRYSWTLLANAYAAIAIGYSFFISFNSIQLVGLFFHCMHSFHPLKVWRWFFMQLFGKAKACPTNCILLYSSDLWQNQVDSIGFPHHTLQQIRFCNYVCSNWLYEQDCHHKPMMKVLQSCIGFFVAWFWMSFIFEVESLLHFSSLLLYYVWLF